MRKSLHYLSFILLALVLWPPPKGYTEQEFSLGPCDRWIPAKTRAKGLMLLTHGLNLLPARMDELGEAFAQQGYEVFRPAFSGHCKEGKSLRQVTAEDWQTDARRFHSIASHQAKILGLSLSLTAYSFSALIFQVMDGELSFGKKIYFAPALDTKFWYPFVLWFANLFPDLIFHTMVPDGYYANERAGFRPVLELNKFYEQWKRGEGKQGASPVLLLADPEDELVNGDGLIRLAASQKGWTFESLSVEGSTLPKAYHHLVIDSAALGKQEWARVLKLALSFLGGK